VFSALGSFGTAPEMTFPIRVARLLTQNNTPTSAAVRFITSSPTLVGPCSLEDVFDAPVGKEPD
jgi:hypothetical protein